MPFFLTPFEEKKTRMKMHGPKKDWTKDGEKSRNQQQLAFVFVNRTASDREENSVAGAQELNLGEASQWELWFLEDTTAAKN